MKKTEKMGLNLMESSDPFSAAPLNENTTKLDAAVGANSAAVKEHGEAIKSYGETLTSHTNAISSHSNDLSALKTTAAKIPDKAMMACGTYAGDGRSSVTIPTPGFKASTLMIRCLTDSPAPVKKVEAHSVKYQSGDTECEGFTMWAGQNLNTKAWYKDGTAVVPGYGGAYVEVPVYSCSAATIKFTAGVGTLSWELSDFEGTLYRPGVCVNNEDDKTYEWVAFGTEVV